MTSGEHRTHPRDAVTLISRRRALALCGSAAGSLFLAACSGARPSFREGQPQVMPEQRHDGDIANLHAAVFISLADRVSRAGVKDRLNALAKQQHDDAIIDFRGTENEGTLLLRVPFTDAVTKQARYFGVWHRFKAGVPEGDSTYALYDENSHAISEVHISPDQVAMWRKGAGGSGDRRKFTATATQFEEPGITYEHSLDVFRAELDAMVAGAFDGFEAQYVTR